jgi:hypothetical protein
MNEPLDIILHIDDTVHLNPPITTMSQNIEQLKAERITIMEALERMRDSKLSERLRDINYLLNVENQWSNVYYYGFGEYIEVGNPDFIGEIFRKQIASGEYIHAYLSSHGNLDAQAVSNLSPCTPYDYENMEHKCMMKEKSTVRVTINPRPVEYGCTHFDISTNLSFSYYLDGNRYEMNLDIYVRDGYKWTASGINWSAMGTTTPEIALLYAEMIKVGVQIHNSLNSTAMHIKHTAPEYLT